MDFINDVNLIPGAGRSKNDISPQLTYFFHSVVRSAIYLDDVYVLTEVYCDTTIAFAAGLYSGGIGGKAIKRFCQDACHSGFPDAAGAGKKVGVGDPAGLYGVFERLANNILANDVIERL
jgi:hypothetical protein